MALSIIIDGYNLIRTTDLNRAEAEGGLEAGRSVLIGELAAYKRLKRHALTVVFDGASPLGQQVGRERGIKTVFTPTGRTADEAIVEMVGRAKGEVLVVTSDRELANRVRANGGDVVSSAEFRERLSLAAYLDLKGGDDEEERPVKPKKGPSRRPPKAERRRRRRLSKL